MTEGALGVGGEWSSKRVYCLLISRAAMHKSRRKRRKNSKNQLPRRPLSASMTADWSGWKKKAGPLLEAASMVRVSSCFWPPASVSNSGIYGGGGAWNPGQVPSPVVDNIHEGPPSLPPSSLIHPRIYCPSSAAAAAAAAGHSPLNRDPRFRQRLLPWLRRRGRQVWETLRKCVSIFPGYRG